MDLQWMVRIAQASNNYALVCLDMGVVGARDG